MNLALLRFVSWRLYLPWHLLTIRHDLQGTRRLVTGFCDSCCHIVVAMLCHMYKDKVVLGFILESVSHICHVKGLVQPGPSLVRRRPREGPRTLTLTHWDPHADTSGRVRVRVPASA